MPLSQNDPALDYGGSWGDASHNWPKISFRSKADAEKAYVLAWKKAKVPYGSYVLVDKQLRLETKDYVRKVRAMLAAGASE